MKLRNACQFIGNLGKDPEMRYLPTGTPLTKFSVAVNTGYGDDKTTTWVDFSAFGKQAEIINQLCKKGTLVCVNARYEKSQKTGDDGRTQYYHNFVVQEIEILSNLRKDGEDGGEEDGEAGEEYGQGSYAPGSFANDDVPF